MELTCLRLSFQKHLVLPPTAKTNGPKERLRNDIFTLLSNPAASIQRHRHAWREHTLYSTIRRIATAKTSKLP